MASMHVEFSEHVMVRWRHAMPMMSMLPPEKACHDHAQHDNMQ